MATYGIINIVNMGPPKIGDCLYNSRASFDVSGSLPSIEISPLRMHLRASTSIQLQSGAYGNKTGDSCEIRKLGKTVERKCYFKKQLYIFKDKLN